jgi:hypothetical protein
MAQSDVTARFAKRYKKRADLNITFQQLETDDI